MADTLVDVRGRRVTEMGSEGWAVFDGPRMIASNLTEQDARVLANADALLAVVPFAKHTDHCLARNFSDHECDCGLDKALAALPEYLRGESDE